MEIGETELIYEAGKEAVVKVLMEMDARNRVLERRVCLLEDKVYLDSSFLNVARSPNAL